MRGIVLALVLFPALVVAAEDFIRLPGGEFRSTLKYEDTGGKVHLPPFALMQRPVTNAEFLDFVKANPQWQRDQVAPVFAESRYLQQWAAPLEPGNNAKPMQPVVNVCWFAAQAFCDARGARLPTWNEWEFAAAADATRRDARADPAWRESILNWYARPSNAPLSEVGQTPANAYGVQNMNDLVWEWVDDFSGMLVSGDSRNQQDPDRLKFCGAGALAVDDRENYAVLMRVAMLSSLEAHDTTGNLGFRCAKDLP